VSEPGAIYRVSVEIAPEAEERWSRWYVAEHMRDVVAQGAFLGATRWRDIERASDGWPRYVVDYTAESIEAIESYRRSEAGARLREDHERLFGAVTRLNRSVLTAPVPAGEPQS
jgi:hypothetical protein